jgi:hypothetical protein
LRGKKPVAFRMVDNTKKKREQSLTIFAAAKYNEENVYADVVRIYERGAAYEG